MYLDWQSLLTSKVVVSIPINLYSRQEIASALIDKYGTSYLFMGRVFQATTINQSCVIDIHDLALPTAKGDYPQGTLRDRSLRGEFVNRPNDRKIDSSAQIYPGSLEKMANKHNMAVAVSMP